MMRIARACYRANRKAIKAAAQTMAVTGGTHSHHRSIFVLWSSKTHININRKRSNVFQQVDTALMRCGDQNTEFAQNQVQNYFCSFISKSKKVDKVKKQYTTAELNLYIQMYQYHKKIAEQRDTRNYLASNLSKCFLAFRMFILVAADAEKCRTTFDGKCERET
jgi:hypothetical protein